MLLDNLSSETVVALSMGQLISVIAGLSGIIGIIITYARKTERDDVRLKQVEARVLEQEKLLAESSRNQQMTQQQLLLLTQEVRSLTEALNREHKPAPTARRSKPAHS